MNQAYSKQGRELGTLKSSRLYVVEVTRPQEHAFPRDKGFAMTGQLLTRPKALATKTLLAFATLLALARSADAQLVIGVSPDQQNYHLCIATNTSAAMWIGLPTVVGCAADDANQILYVSETFNIFSTPYNGGNPSFVTAPIDTMTGGPIRCEALAFGDPFGTGAKLYAVHEFAGVPQEGIYEIDLNAGTGTPVYIFPDTTIDIGGLAFNPADNLFYGTNDGAGYPGGQGIIAFDIVNQVEAFIAPYNGNTDVDGCAVDPAGWVYLVEDEASPLHRWDLNNNQYDPNPQQSPVTGATTFSGATWAPSLNSSCGAIVHGSTITLSGSAAQGTTIELDFAPVMTSPPTSCHQAHTVTMQSQSADEVRNELIRKIGEVCPANSMCDVFLIRDPADPGGIIAKGTCIFQCWVKNGSMWELVNGQTIDGITYSKKHHQGTSYCGPTVSNSTGQPGVIIALGSDVAASNDILLQALQLPTNQFGYFLNSQAQGFVFPIPNSQGALCLGGPIGRYLTNVFSTGTSGSGVIQLDLSSTPTPTGTVAIQAGETWNFQCWHRDNNPTLTSNFTNGVSITFL